jgi:hypothetical protein
MRLRIAEIDQHPVAHVFGDKAIEAADRLGHGAVIAPDQLPQILRIEPRRERGRADEVAEHDRQLATFRRVAARWRRLCDGLGRRRPERRYRLEHDFAMAEEDAELFKIGLAQFG